MLPPKGVTPKIKLQIKKRCKLARGVNVKRQKTNGCAVRAGCMPNTHNMSAVDSRPVFRPSHYTIHIIWVIWVA